MNYIKKPFVLCAFNIAPKQEVELLSSLGLSFKPVLGRYKGVDEQSYLVVVDDKNDIDRLAHWLKEYKQESYLYVDENRRAKLVFLDDKSTIELGRFGEVTPVEALKLDAYTLDMSTGTYYTCS